MPSFEIGRVEKTREYEEAGVEKRLKKKEEEILLHDS